jgi:hypothetical protein
LMVIVSKCVGDIGHEVKEHHARRARNGVMALRKMENAESIASC